MDVRVIAGQDVPASVTWATVVDAIRAGHRRPPPTTDDTFLTRGDDTLLSRAAWIDGLGAGVKSVTVVPGNPTRELPTVQGAMLLFDDHTGALRAVIDSQVVTWWKTAADSVLAATILARPDSRRMLVVGAGVVARSLVEAYVELFPGIERIEVWNRTEERARRLVDELAASGRPVETATSLTDAVGRADIVATATTSREPVLRGAWVGPGTHVDLVGAFRADMREADDALIGRAELFVDSRQTTLDDIGELRIPLAAGVIGPEAVRGDLYDLCAGSAGRSGPEAVTVCKNGGGAHLDVMVAHALVDACDRERSGVDPSGGS